MNALRETATAEWLGETYTIRNHPHITGYKLLEVTGHRGQALAKAVGGSWSTAGVNMNHSFAITPGRGDKFGLLFRAGFSAVPSPHSWRYERPGEKRMNLSEAVAVARAMVAISA